VCIERLVGSYGDKKREYLFIEMRDLFSSLYDDLMEKSFLV
jgi:hypothetical protein